MNDSDGLLGTEVCKNQPGTSASRPDTRKESEQKRRVTLTESRFFDEVAPPFLPPARSSYNPIKCVVFLSTVTLSRKLLS